MELFLTKDRPQSERIDYWNAVCSDTYDSVGIEPGDAPMFQGRLQRLSEGRFTISELACSPVTVLRSRHHVSRQRGGRTVNLFLAMKGRGSIEVGAESTGFEPGAFMLLDADTPYRYSSDMPVTLLAIGFPKSVVDQRVPAHCRLLNSPIAHDSGLARATAGALSASRHLIDRDADGELPASFFLGLLDLLWMTWADACGGEPGPDAKNAAWQARIRSAIDLHLSDPALGPSAIARQLGISPRYLRMLFGEGSEETLRRHILRRRLEQCAARLADPSWHGTSITELAFRWGFSDSSYFTRKFAERYGVSPRVYRDRARDGQVH